MEGGGEKLKQQLFRAIKKARDEPLYQKRRSTPFCRLSPTRKRKRVQDPLESEVPEVECDEFYSEEDPAGKKMSDEDQNLLIVALRENAKSIRLESMRSHSRFHVFPTQAKALEFLSSAHVPKTDFSTSDLDVESMWMLFAKEVSDTGCRKYVAATMSDFYNRYSMLAPDERHHYEVFREGAPCHLYFDLEFSTSLNPRAVGDVMVDALLRLVDHEASVLFRNSGRLWPSTHSHRGKMYSFATVELDSSLPEKFSRHVILRFPGLAFRDNYDVGLFVRHVLCVAYDLSCESRSDHCHSDREIWDANPGDEKDLRKLAKTIFVDTPESNGKSPLSQTFVDAGVYSRNRCFRLLQSSKHAKCSYLEPTPSTSKTFPGTRELFFHSVASYVDRQHTTLITFAPQEGAAVTDFDRTFLITYIPPASSAGLPSAYNQARDTQGPSKSSYPPRLMHNNLPSRLMHNNLPSPPTPPLSDAHHVTKPDLSNTTHNQPSPPELSASHQQMNPPTQPPVSGTTCRKVLSSPPPVLDQGRDTMTHTASPPCVPRSPSVQTNEVQHPQPCETRAPSERMQSVHAEPTLKPSPFEESPSSNIGNTVDGHKPSSDNKIDCMRNRIACHGLCVEPNRPNGCIRVVGKSAQDEPTCDACYRNRCKRCCHRISEAETHSLVLGDSMMSDNQIGGNMKGGSTAARSAEDGNGFRMTPDVDVDRESENEGGYQWPSISQDITPRVDQVSPNLEVDSLYVHKTAGTSGASQVGSHLNGQLAAGTRSASQVGSNLCGQRIAGISSAYQKVHGSSAHTPGALMTVQRVSDMSVGSEANGFRSGPDVCVGSVASNLGGEGGKEDEQALDAAALLLLALEDELLDLVHDHDANGGDGTGEGPTDTEGGISSESRPGEFEDDIGCVGNLNTVEDGGERVGGLNDVDIEVGNIRDEHYGSGYGVTPTIVSGEDVSRCDMPTSATVDNSVRGEGGNRYSVSSNSVGGECSGSLYGMHSSATVDNSVRGEGGSGYSVSSISVGGECSGSLYGMPTIAAAGDLVGSEATDARRSSDVLVLPSWALVGLGIRNQAINEVPTRGFPITSTFTTKPGRIGTLTSSDGHIPHPTNPSTPGHGDTSARSLSRVNPSDTDECSLDAVRNTAKGTAATCSTSTAGASIVNIQGGSLAASGDSGAPTTCSRALVEFVGQCASAAGRGTPVVKPFRCYKHLVMFNISGNRFCHNVGREHRSNGVFYVADMARCTVHQRCHDPDCRALGFRSTPIPIPAEVIATLHACDGASSTLQACDGVSSTLQACDGVSSTLHDSAARATSSNASK